jgi:Asp-tRNA(Asn)/Glu-tRNA(Gln) amidotransferase A subunit family amidase
MNRPFHTLAAALGAVLACGAAAQQAPAFDVTEKSIRELQAAQAEGRTTARALVEQYLARIRAYDQAGPALNAMVSLNPRALEEADALDRERKLKGPRGPLHGIPVVLKDNFETRDMPTTGGTLALATFRPQRDAFQVQRLRAAGAIILGKTALHELAAGTTTVSSLTGATRNPYDLQRVPGGSSGGTAAAVAASFAAAGMGSDTCGSIRIPAGNQNLVGLRVTRGLSSRSGVIPLSSTQDEAGPLARSVTDLALLLDATVGFDPADPVTADAARHVPRSYADLLGDGTLRGKRIGVLKSLISQGPDDEEVAAIVRKALETMKGHGAELVEIAVPELDELMRDGNVIAQNSSSTSPSTLHAIRRRRSGACRRSSIAAWTMNSWTRCSACATRRRSAQARRTARRSPSRPCSARE